MSNRGIRIRDQSARFLGALVGLVVYVLLVVMLSPQSDDPTSTTGLLWFMFGALVITVFGSWLLPWIRRRFSARHARHRGLKKSGESS